MTTKKIEKDKKAPVKRTKKVAPASSPEEVAIALVLAQALGTPHDGKSYQLTVRHKEFDPQPHKLQNMRVISQKQYYIQS